MKRRPDAIATRTRRSFRMRSQSWTRARLGANCAREVETPDASFRLHARRAGREPAGVQARTGARESEDHDVDSAAATTP
jgi:hypothetical protein